MAGTTKEQANGQLSSKDARKNIIQQLETLLADWKEQLGEKKFKSRIEKAAKVFSKGLPVVAKKAALAPKKKAAKPAGVKKAKVKTTAKKAATAKAATKAPRGTNKK
ncbi:hypothetical protein [Chitinophaga sp. 22620]|uniref:hypothetical protein n=1 Tax=Chitinophaga sp. 22620 TaxID=3453952 RepID=UPI003F8346E9